MAPRSWYRFKNSKLNNSKIFKVYWIDLMNSGRQMESNFSSSKVHNYSRTDTVLENPQGRPLRSTSSFNFRRLKRVEKLKNFIGSQIGKQISKLDLKLRPYLNYKLLCHRKSAKLSKSTFHNHKPQCQTKLQKMRNLNETRTLLSTWSKHWKVQNLLK